MPYPGTPDSLATLGVGADGVSCTLTSPMLIGDTVAQVDNAANVPQWSLITFGAELMQVSLVTGNQLTFGTPTSSPDIAGRGLSGTTVAPHATGVIGYLNVNAFYQQALAEAVIAIETALTAGLATIAAAAPVVTSFTPFLAFDFVTTGITYAQQTGEYIQSGNIILVRLTLTLTSKGVATGDATIGGLPMSASGAVGAFFGVIGLAVNMTSVANPVARLAGGDPDISLWNAFGGTAMTDANFTDTTSIEIAIAYYIL